MKDIVITVWVNIIYYVWLHQKHYMTLMLRKFGLADANTISTPADCNIKLVKDDHMSKSTEYQSMVGSHEYSPRHYPSSGLD